jgi:hypothetical protein
MSEMPSLLKLDGRTREAKALKRTEAERRRIVAGLIASLGRDQASPIAARLS